MDRDHFARRFIGYTVDTETGKKPRNERSGYPHLQTCSYTIRRTRNFKGSMYGLPQ